MSLALLKTTIAITILIAGLVGALLPWLLRTKLPSERLMARADTFAGGVLAGAGLIHLLPSGIEGFHTFVPRLEYPIALLLAGLGFLLILMIESVVTPEQSPADNPERAHRSQHPSAANSGAPDLEQSGSDFGPAVCPELDYGPRQLEKTGHYAFILLLVLSVHSIIVGTALGAQESFYDVLVIFVAVIAHKSVAGFALGVGYERTGMPWRRAIPGIAFFATMTPIGIMIGTTVGALATAHSAHVFNAIFDSIGAGTFLYIGVLDIIRTEFSKPEDRFAKWLATCLGFGIMAVLALWI
jgi:zinc transporter 1/2/3